MGIGWNWEGDGGIRPTKGQGHQQLLPLHLEPPSEPDGPTPISLALCLLKLAAVSPTEGNKHHFGPSGVLGASRLRVGLPIRRDVKSFKHTRTQFQSSQLC